jgi:hypothetical protein
MATKSGSMKFRVLLIGAAISMLGVIIDTYQQAALQPKLSAAQTDLAAITNSKQHSYGNLMEGEHMKVYATIISGHHATDTQRLPSTEEEKAGTLYENAIFYMRTAVSDARSSADSGANLAEAQIPQAQVCDDKPYEQNDTRLRKEWDCYNNRLRAREITDAKTVASLDGTLAVWTGIGRALQLLGVLVGIAKDFVA